MTHGTWVSVAQALPEISEPYKGGPRTSGLVITFNGHYVSVGAYEETYAKREPRWLSRHGRREAVTHWMALPEAPNAE